MPAVAQLLVFLIAGGVVLGLVAWLFPAARRGPGWAVSALRRAWWVLKITSTWKGTCRDSGLSKKVTKSKARGTDTLTVEGWKHPKIRRLSVSGHAVTIRIKARRGQTIAELEAGAERLAAAYGVQTFRCWPLPKRPASVLVVEFVMRELLAKPRTATLPEVPRAIFDAVPVGTTQAGREWLLKVRGWHTLVVGASGSGKGSILWNICCGLAPAVKAEHVQLWGIDLKKGLELSIGDPLFHARAYEPEAAIEVLKNLIAVIDERGAQMIGNTRLHVPTAGDPLHVLVIDELAAVTAYAERDVKNEANRLLSLILTQGRALGVVVVAFVQDPRKEVINARGLFTQTIALRLRTREETSMVLGDGMAKLAPAHRINPSCPGTAWVVEDSGAVDRARATYWPDEAIREAARLWGSRDHSDTTVLEPITEEGEAA
ncbi:FtsK/SpoIIIE domain-containing protein [Nocardioides sp.]|uniref:FtsK/SpoIIIE domain-containing protein n=1 Tax=Nocardioides sp. TaxID=35761 RepID=UPI002B90ACF2|nr:FtsK/SpoIIIE domain-containing protein [Nocardioides sp.]HSX69050.1 FtsK/SpoIIIE domain-containing protein [Nocardioides sp.]